MSSWFHLMYNWAGHMLFCGSTEAFAVIYVGNSMSKLQIQVATYVVELSAGNCHR
jgi:hypothetical protein